MTAISERRQLAYIAAQAADARVNLELEAEGMTLNIGPQHPATHGTLRIVLRLDGELRAFADRCPHRLAPLSIGTTVAGPDGDRLACGYHGLPLLLKELIMLMLGLS